MVLTGPNVLLVATNKSLFRSVDGGLNFGANVPFFDDGLLILIRFVSDLHPDSGSTSTIVYAAIRVEGIFMATDNGITFPINLFSNPGAPSRPYDFIAFSKSIQPDNRTMYVSVSRVGKNIRGFSNPSTVAQLGIFYQTQLTEQQRTMIHRLRTIKRLVVPPRCKPYLHRLPRVISFNRRWLDFRYSCYFARQNSLGSSCFDLQSKNTLAKQNDPIVCWYGWRNF